MEQMRLAQTDRRAQIDLDHHRLGPGGETRRLLCLGDVAGERHLRRRGRHRADLVAHHQFAAYEVESAHHGVGGVEHLGQTDPGSGPHGGQRFGESCPGDQVIGRCCPTTVANESGCVDEEAGDAVAARVFEHVAIPARTVDTGRVTRARRQPAMCPRDPCDCGLDLGQAAERGGIGRDVGCTR